MIKICVIGLGYVGLPICLKLSSYFNTVGFDINKERIMGQLEASDDEDDLDEDELDDIPPQVKVDTLVSDIED